MLQLMKTHGGLYSGDTGLALGEEAWESSLVRVAGRLADLIRVQLVRITSIERFQSEMHPDFAPLMKELFFCKPGERFLRAKRSYASKDRLAALPVRPLQDFTVNSFLLASMRSLFSVGRLPKFIRHLAHMIRNLVVAELVVVGDLYDRGPRADLVTPPRPSPPSSHFNRHKTTITTPSPHDHHASTTTTTPGGGRADDHPRNHRDLG